LRQGFGVSGNDLAAAQHMIHRASKLLFTPALAGLPGGGGIG
jgi:hypothetical protein